MPPGWRETSERNSETNMQLRLWAKKDGSDRRSTRREVFNSEWRYSFARRSLDFAGATSRAHDGGAREVHSSLPDFVIEIRSRTLARLITPQAFLGFSRILDRVLRTIYIDTAAP